MKMLATALAALFLATACATGAPVKESRYEAYCKTHARKVTLNESPDVENAFRNCMHLEGIHEVEVKKVE